MGSHLAVQQLTVIALFMRSHIASAAIACDYTRLEALGRERGTFRFGPGGSASAYWRTEEALGHRPLASLVRLFRLPYAKVGNAYLWPSAARGHPATSAWNALVRAGLLTREQAADQRAHGNVYTGWRAVITGDGDWLSYTFGR